MTKGYIGLSLSACLGDILEGKVQENRVFCIITSTMCLSPEQVVNSYPNTTAKGQSREEVVALVGRLWDRIVQPRKAGVGIPVPMTDKSHWIEWDLYPCGMPPI